MALRIRIAYVFIQSPPQDSRISIMRSLLYSQVKLIPRQQQCQRRTAGASAAAMGCRWRFGCRSLALNQGRLSLDPLISLLAGMNDSWCFTRRNSTSGYEANIKNSEIGRIVKIPLRAQSGPGYPENKNGSQPGQEPRERATNSMPQPAWRRHMSKAWSISFFVTLEVSLHAIDVGCSSQLKPWQNGTASSTSARKPKGLGDLRVKYAQ